MSQTGADNLVEDTQKSNELRQFSDMTPKEKFLMFLMPVGNISSFILISVTEPSIWMLCLSIFFGGWAAYNRFGGSNPKDLGLFFNIPLFISSIIGLAGAETVAYIFGIIGCLLLLIQFLGFAAILVDDVSKLAKRFKKPYIHALTLRTYCFVQSAAWVFGIIMLALKLAD